MITSSQEFFFLISIKFAINRELASAKLFQLRRLKGDLFIFSFSREKEKSGVTIDIYARHVLSVVLFTVIAIADHRRKEKNIQLSQIYIYVYIHSVKRDIREQESQESFSPLF